MEDFKDKPSTSFKNEQSLKNEVPSLQLHKLKVMGHHRDQSNASIASSA